MHLEGFDRYEEGDVIESFELEKIRPTFNLISPMSLRIARVTNLFVEKLLHI